MAEPVGLQEGLVIAGHGRHVWVETPQGRKVICHARGRKSQTVVGDQVLWQASQDEGTIEKVLPRRNLLYRQDEIRTKSFAANIDQVLIVLGAEPEFSDGQLSRALIAAAAQDIAVLIVLNKRDLGGLFEAAWQRLAPYRAMDYPVLAHELGHFPHKPLPKRIVAIFAMSLAGFALLGWLGTQVWFYTGLGVLPNLQGPNDALALMLFLLAIPSFTGFLGPLFAQLSRKHEFEADAYAMAQTRGADLASALLKLYEDNASTLTPDPWYVKFYYSHPPASERLARMYPGSAIG